MSIADVVEENVNSNYDVKDIADSFDRTKNEDGENVDAFFTNLLKDKNLWNYTK
ncbi:MAG: hypothetical protein Q4F88_07195 [Eubacteriales bacterium]|nr:hypothetical protein [Eubacteriales bacterium]